MSPDAQILIKAVRGNGSCFQYVAVLYRSLMNSFQTRKVKMCVVLCFVVFLCVCLFVCLFVCLLGVVLCWVVQCLGGLIGCKLFNVMHKFVQDGDSSEAFECG